MSDNKQIPNSILGTHGISPTTVGNGLSVYHEGGYDEAMRLYPEFKFFWDRIKMIEEKKAKEVVKYTLEQAAENAKIQDVAGDTYDLIWDKNDKEYSISEQSILSLEEQIIKDLKL